MDKKFPTVVNIGGRRYVKNNLNKDVDNSKMRLKEAVKSLGRRVQKAQATHCIVEHGEELDVYESDDIKVILGRSNKPVGFIITGKPENIGRDKYGKVPNDLEDVVEELNKVNVRGDDEV